ncbi:hypothetical protein OIU84_012020 [Salix udensis]|uniref:Uncharacterized protein n=1 Tax=Salix udensis TaxID=889485 RepID=A0AAD6JF34_9ROSI|nr:hypothetical protein OIU84_012020 [Salix udensis]
MDYSLYTTSSKTLSLQVLPPAVKSRKLPSISFPSWTFKSSAAFLNRKVEQNPRRGVSVIVVARAGSSSHCEPSSSSSSLNTPLELRSSAGKYLSGVFQNQRQLFHVAVADELKLLADDRDSASSRMVRSTGSDEASLHRSRNRCMAVERSSCLIVLHMDVLITIVINVLYYLIESNGVTQLPNNSVSLLLSSRRIAELKEDECRVAVEDVMYMLVLYKFSEIRVPLVPKLSRCIYNGRLEIRPSKDWELESIHSFEVLEMVREHVSTVIGLKANSSVADSWATTEVQKCQIGRVYAASILYGYFLKSASLRHHLDWCLALPHQDIHLGHRTTLQFPESQPSYGMKNLVFGHMSNEQSESQGTRLDRPKSELEKLKCYMMGFDSDTLHRCAKLKSEEAVNLIEKHSCALFGDEKTGVLENDEVILTSFSSLKRLVLEAVAFVRVLGCYSVLGEVKALLAVYVLRIGSGLQNCKLRSDRIQNPESRIQRRVRYLVCSKNFMLPVVATSKLHALMKGSFRKFWVDSINPQPGSGPWFAKDPRPGCRLPSQALQGGLQLIADATRACFELVLEFIVEKISSSTAAAFDLLIEGISASAALTGSALEGLVEKTRNSLHGVLENSLSQLAEDFGEMISAIMTAFWNNYKDAVRYFTENA